MEYSLQQLNKIGILKNLTLNNFIETLNLIGLEIDEVNVENLTNYLSISDIKLIIKIPANREDLLNQTILVDELSNIFFFKTLKIWEKLQKKYFFLVKQKYFNYSTYSIVPIKSDIKNYLSYAIKIENYKEKKIPTWIQNKIKLESLEKTTFIQSLINLTILEWGQSFNTLNSNDLDLKIEYLQKEEKYSFRGENYFLNNGTIVLKNKTNQIISVLGIINPFFKDKTLLIEANFYDINKNILELNDVNTKLSYRYLRRHFLTNFKFAFQRLLTLIEIIGEASINPIIYKTENSNLELNSYLLLKMNINSFKKFLNIDNYDKEIFEKNGLKIVCKTPEALYFRIPDFRKDLTREIDLIEEYARFIGYKNFKEILPKVLPTKILKNKSKKISFIKQFFLNYNFNEVFTNSLVSGEKVNKNSIYIQNPLNFDLALLRTSLISNFMDIFYKNLKFGINNLKFFEIGRIYKKEENKFIEQEYLSTIFPIEFTKNNLDSKLDFFVAKGFIENFLSSFTNKNFIFENLIEENEYYHPKKYLKIIDDNNVIGYFGEIHPKYKKLFSVKQNIYIFELNLDLITTKNLKSKIRIYKDYSKYPLITKDLSILIAKNINFYNLKDNIMKKINFLKSINFFDIYFDKNNSDKISLGIRLEFQSNTKTLINQDIETEIEKVTLFLKENFNAEFKI